jgi:hypothetical protein
MELFRCCWVMVKFPNKATCCLCSAAASGPSAFRHAGFKVWGIMPITIAFALSQTPLILKYEVKDEKAAPKD